MKDFAPDELSPPRSALAAAPPPVLEPPPLRIGRYRIARTLGQGASGTVYLARDPRLERDVALKVPHPEVLETPEDVERFFREARALATLSHPNICPVYDVDDLDGRPYIVMAWIDGQPLSTLVAPDRPLPPRQAAAIVRKVALALEAAHRQGVIHRDLKCPNVMLDAARREPIVMDFGLARRTRHGDATLTQTGQILGTPAYMSPEQARGAPEAVSPASDIYSVGAILYELITGRPPFDGPLLDVLRQLFFELPTPPSAVRPEVDAALEAICLRALAKDPSDRFGSMGEMATALGGYLRTGARCADAPVAMREASRSARRARPSVAPPSGQNSGDRVERRPGWVRRLARRLTLLGLLLLALTGAAWFAGSQFNVVRITVEGLQPGDADCVRIDGHEYPAPRLARPILLRAGKHELTVERAGKVVKRQAFSLPGASTGVWEGKWPGLSDWPALQFELTQDDIERHAAERLLARGARLTLAHGGELIRPRTVADLPHSAFQVVVLDCRGVRDFDESALMDVQFLTALREIDAAGTRLTDAALRHLAPLDGLVSLDLSGAAIDGSGLAVLDGLTHLEHLALSRTAVADATLSPVATLAQLRELRLDGTKITDAAVEPLRRLAGLERLDLRTTGMSATAAAELRSALPRCAIEHDAPPDEEPPVALVEAPQVGGPIEVPRPVDPPPAEAPLPELTEQLEVGPADTQDPLARTTPYVLDLQSPAIGALPVGWTGDDVVSIRHYEGIRVLNSGKTGRHVAKSPELAIAGDFYLQFDLLNGKSSELQVTLRGADGASDLVMALRRRQTSSWEVEVPGVDPVRVAGYDYGPTTIRLERRGQIYLLVTNSDTLHHVTFRSDAFGAFSGLDVQFDSTSIHLSQLRIGPLDQDEATAGEEVYEWSSQDTPVSDLPEGWRWLSDASSHPRYGSPPIDLHGSFVLDLQVVNDNSQGGQLIVTLLGRGSGWDLPLRFEAEPNRGPRWTAVVPAGGPASVRTVKNTPTLLRVERKLDKVENVIRVSINGEFAAMRQSERFGEFKGLELDFYGGSITVIGVRAAPLTAVVLPDGEEGAGDRPRRGATTDVLSR